MDHRVNKMCGDGEEIAVRDVEVGIVDGKEESLGDQTSMEINPPKNNVKALIEQKEDEQTFLCQICFDSFPNSQTYRLSLCTHRFCTECITSFVRYKVIDGNVYPKCCYFLNNDLGIVDNGDEKAKPIFCEADIVHNDMVTLLESDLDTIEKYHRYKYCRENKNARECPKCHTFQLGTPERSTKMVCVRCDHIYCFYHADAHDFNKYPTCKEYDTAMAPTLKESEDLIRTTTKPCPGCGKAVMKSGGCSHMKCSCGVAFCWLCGKQIDDALFPAHFQWWNPSGCSNLQMNEAVDPSTTARCCAKILTIFQLIILGPLTLLSTLVSSLLCLPCVIAYMRTDDRNMTPWVMFSNCLSSWGIFWMIVLFGLPIGLALLAVAAGLVLALGIACYPFYAIVRMAMGQYPWPDWVTDSCHERMTSLRWRYRLWRRRRGTSNHSNTGNGSRQNSMMGNNNSRGNSINGGSSPAISRSSSSSSLRRGGHHHHHHTNAADLSSLNNKDRTHPQEHGRKEDLATNKHSSSPQQGQHKSLMQDDDLMMIDIEAGYPSNTFDVSGTAQHENTFSRPSDISNLESGLGHNPNDEDEQEQEAVDAGEKRLSRTLQILESLENVPVIVASPVAAAGLVGEDQVWGHHDLETGGER